jgi:transposase
MPSLPDLSQLSHAQKDELIMALFAQVQTLLSNQALLHQRTQGLEARLGLNSRNSSKPPSSDGLRKPAPKSLRVAGQRPSGGQKGHPGNTLRTSESVDAVIEHKGAEVCATCQSTLLHHETIDQRQVFDLPPLRLQVIEHHLMRSYCTCGAVHEGTWPQGVTGAVQYGAGVKALAVHLSQQHLVPLGRVCALMQDAFGVSLSQASVASFNAQAAQALVPTVAAIGQAVKSQAVVHADESGIRVKGKLHWLHCLVSQQLTWLGQHARRGAQAFEALGLLAGVRGTLVHDGLASYKELQCTHALCNAHHLRELVFVHEQERPFDGWAKEMMDLLMQANREVGQHGGSLAKERQRWYEAQWDVLLARADSFNPENTDYLLHAPRRGRHKQSKAFNLIRRLRMHRAEVWRFMTEPGVPFTNNLAEQALRMCKVKQKISGCFRTVDGANTFFTIRSYLQTMTKQKQNLLQCLTSVFNGQPIQPQFVG